MYSKCMGAKSDAPARHFDRKDKAIFPGPQPFRQAKDHVKLTSNIHMRALQYEVMFG